MHQPSAPDCLPWFEGEYYAAHPQEIAQPVEKSAFHVHRAVDALRDADNAWARSILHPRRPARKRHLWRLIDVFRG